MTQKLRVRHAGGSVTIPNQTTAQGVGEAIQEITAIPWQEQVWKSGYPPQHVSVLASDPLPFEVDLLQVVSESSNHDNNYTPSIRVPPKRSTFTSSSSFLFSSPPGDPLNEPPMLDPDGSMVRRVVDSDNSCLFHSISHAFSGEVTSAQLRQLVADAVRADPTTYTEAILGKQPEEYAQWIEASTSWGGQIELIILSRLLKVEIVALDIGRGTHDIYQPTNLLETPQDTATTPITSSCRRRIYVLYDGIHYDAVAYTFDPRLPPSQDTRICSPNDTLVLEKAQALCRAEHERKAYTDLHNFTLRCLVCQAGLEGQVQAVQHAQSTGHSNFAEY